MSESKFIVLYYIYMEDFSHYINLLLTPNQLLEVFKTDLNRKCWVVKFSKIYV